MHEPYSDVERESTGTCRPGDGQRRERPWHWV